MGCACCKCKGRKDDGEEIFVDLLEDPKAYAEKRAREKRQLAVTAAEEAAAKEDAEAGRLITESHLASASDAEASLPDWQFELEKGQWRSYSIEESRALDRHWEAYMSEVRKGTPNPPHVARFQIKEKSGTIDFANMTCSLSGGRPRRIMRAVRQRDWLSNDSFVEAFTSVMNAAGIEVENGPNVVFDFRFNQDLRGVTADAGRKFPKRGGQPYDLPVGWKRFAVNVQGLYNDPKGVWLKDDNSGWAVAYYGISKESMPNILGAGFRFGSRQANPLEPGEGIAVSPWIGAAQHYSKPQKHSGHDIQMVLQLRVRPGAIRQNSKSKASEFERKFWVIQKLKDIRAYGVIVRELPIAQYIPPEVKVYGKDHPAAKKALQELREQIEKESGDSKEAHSKVPTPVGSFASRTSSGAH